MSRRAPARISQMLAVTVLTATFAGAAAAVHPACARAAATHAITLQLGTIATPYDTSAATVGDFLRERGLTVGPHDFLSPQAGAPLRDGTIVIYRAAVPVTIAIGRQTTPLVSSAPDVASLLQERQIAVGSDDIVRPALSDPLTAGETIRIWRVVTWVRNRMQPIAARTIHRTSFSLPPGFTRVDVAGSPGERSVTMRFTRIDGGPIARAVIAAYVLRPPHQRIVSRGAAGNGSLARFAAIGMERSERLAGSALQMVATAYTSGCSGCTGMTAIGRPAGLGIVAVDPRVIPLGTRLYISGYGIAVAGDTGGAIRGLRIDLGFNTLRDAMLFGRRQVTVYRLK